MTSAAHTMVVHLRILIGGEEVANWRLRVLGFVARLLHVPIDVKETA